MNTKAQKSRFGPLVLIFAGLLVAYGVIDAFKDVTKHKEAAQEVVDVQAPTPQAEPPPAAEPPIPEVDGWHAKKTDEIPGIKIAYDVQLARKMSKDELMAIAQRLKSNSHDRTFMCHRLGGRREGMCWATTHADPEIRVLILGGE